MKRFFAWLFIIVVLLGGAAFCAARAQQAAPDPGLATYRQLLTEANDRIVALSVENARVSAVLKAAQDELAKLKEKPEKK